MKYVCATREAFDFSTFALLFVGISWTHWQCVLFFLRLKRIVGSFQIQVSRDFAYETRRREKGTEYYRVESIRKIVYLYREIVKKRARCLPLGTVVGPPHL
jgi:hypothetical protein